MDIFQSSLTAVLSFVSLTILISTIFLFAPIKLVTNYKKKERKFFKLKWFRSLFLSFDPKTSISLFNFDELNWIIILFFLILNFYLFWLIPSRLQNMLTKFISNLVNQFSIALKTKADASSLLFVSTFFLFMNCNLMGLIPNVFTASSHLTFNLFFALSLWTGFFLFGWFTYTNKMFAHLVPLSTPNPLISFMVLIESISTLIRSGTLAIRLMANMISGHLLLTLLGNTMVLKPLLLIIFLILVQCILSSLEIGVGFIQAYVFCMLLSLYSDESDYSVDH